MIYDIINSKDLLKRMREINDWIEKNKENVGNANMYEIMSCMVARNNIRIIEGEKPELDDEVERMISLRSESIREFQTDVPESKPLFDAVRAGLTGESREEMELICKCQSVPFFINNTRKRGFDGDIKMPIEKQNSLALPDFEHDNESEVNTMASSYEEASEGVRKKTYPLVLWTVERSIPDLRDTLKITPTIDVHVVRKIG